MENVGASREDKRDVLAELEQALRAPIARETDPDRAKLQLAVLYYASKAVANADAARKLLETQSFYEACILIRSLYNLTIDFLWLCQEPIVRARRFYDFTAVGFEAEYNRYVKLGIDLPPTATGAAEQNRGHFSRVADDFRDRKGKLRSEWAEGTIRSRAEALERKDPELKPLGEWYELLYKKLSDYEHSAPGLSFEYVQLDDRFVWAIPRKQIGQPTAHTYGQLLGLLVGLVFRAAIGLGVLDRARLTSNSAVAADARKDARG